MFKRRTLIVFMVMAIFVLLLGGIAYAQHNKPISHQGLHGLYIEKLAQILGVDQEKLKDAMEVARKQSIEEAVQKGIITKDQLKRMKQPERLKPIARKLHGPISDIAPVLGMTPEEILKEFKAGKTLADIAGEKGMTLDELKEKLIEKVKTRLDEAAARGKITQEKAGLILERIKQLDLSKFPCKRPVPPVKPSVVNQ